MDVKRTIPSILTLAVIPAVVFGPRVELGQIGFQPIPIRPEDVLLAIVSVWTLIFGRRELSSTPKAWAWAFLGFIAIAAVASWAGDPISKTMSAAYLVKIGEYAAFGFIGSIWLSGRSHARWIMLTLAASSLALGVWLQFPIFGDGWNAARAVLPYDRAGTQQSSLIGAMLLLATLSVAFFGRVRSRALVIMLLASATASMWLMLGSGGRAGILAAAVSVVILLLSMPRTMAVRATFIVGVLGAVGILGITLLAKTESWHFAAERLQESASFSKIAGDRSLNTRSSNWSLYWQIFDEHKSLGNGVPTTKWVDNWFLRLLVETGIVGFMAWMTMSTLVIMHVRRARQRAVDSGDAWSLAFVHFGIVVIVSMVVASLFADQFLSTRVAPMFWLIVGSVVGHSRMELRTAVPPRMSTTGLKLFSGRKPGRASNPARNSAHGYTADRRPA